MSTIFDKLTNIANAIRSKTGKTSALSLDEMATEIDSIVGSGGELTITADTGASITVSNGNTSYTKVVNDGTVVFNGLTNGAWTITGTYNNFTTQEYVDIDISYSKKIVFATFLFNNGTRFPPLTSMTHYDVSIVDNMLQFNKSTKNNTYGPICSNPIDLTGYNWLYVDLESGNYGGDFLYIGFNEETNSPLSPILTTCMALKSPGIYKMSLNNITNRTSCYFGFGASYGTTGAWRINKIWISSDGIQEASERTVLKW